MPVSEPTLDPALFVYTVDDVPSLTLSSGQVAAAKQRRRDSLVEALVGTATGAAVSLVLTYTVLPFYGMPPVGLAVNLQIVAIFTLASIARGYAVRRAFNHHA